MNNNLRIAAAAAALLTASASQAGFLDDLKEAVEDTAKRTAEAVVIQQTEKLVRDMIIGYTSEQTRTNDEVSEEYSKKNGSLPANTTVTSYRSEVLPGSAVSPGTEVRVKSYIEVVRGQNENDAVLEEKLTIWDNEDNTIALKSMTKEAGEEGGGYTSEFSFTLPEGLPQGVYPVSSDLTLNGELVGDKRHALQLVLVGDGRPPALRVARLSTPAP